jgi:hypothetical protein
MTGCEHDVRRNQDARTIIALRPDQPDRRIVPIDAPAFDGVVDPIGLGGIGRIGGRRMVARRNPR